MKFRNDHPSLTIITIPECYIDIDSNTEKRVTAEMYTFIQKHIEQNTFSHALMTALFHYVHGEKIIFPNIISLEDKIDKVLLMLKDQEIPNQTADSPKIPQVIMELKQPEDDSQAHLDELLNEFGG